ncbi:MAG: hypothetical protein R6V75_00580 [Bacteroidales bacterium]
MNDRLKSLAIIAILLSATTGCERYYECDDCDQHSIGKIDQPVLFEFEYINYAWGYRHHGILIDADGNIWGYSQPEEWKIPDSSGFITEEELEFNLEQTDTVYGKVRSTDLVYHYDLIPDARGGNIRDLGTYMADAGVGTLYAYYPRRISRRIERVFLASSGDVNFENTSSAARMIVTWLKETGKDIDRFHWAVD